MLNETQCFEAIDSQNVFKTVFILSTILCIILALAGFYSIIWFERFGSDKKRTVLNKLISSTCYVGMFANGFVQSLYAFRFAYGPLPPLLCFWLCLSKRTVINVAFLLLDSISILRYTFIFWLKNPAAFKDEFWCTYTNLLCILISFIFQVVRATIPGNHHVEYSMCTGEDPTQYFNMPSFGRGYVESFSLTLQILIYIKILLYKRRARTRIGPEGYASHLSNVFNTDLDNRSLSSLAMNIVLGLLLAFGSVFIVIVNFNSCSDFQKFPNYIVIYHTYMLRPCNSCAIIIGIWFFNNPALRQTIWRELKNSF